MKHLAISWGISRGRETYGYNICRLDDISGRKRYRCMGGGYDMIGTVFGNWLEDAHQVELKELATKYTQEDCTYAVPGYKRIRALYGLTINPDGRVSLDGACGINSMVRIAEAMGLSVEWLGNRKGHTVGYLVSGT